MKKTLFIISLMSFFLIGCNQGENGQSKTNNPTSDSSLTTSIVPTATTGTDSSTSQITPPSEDEVKIKIYATNDIHGQIFSESPNSYDGRLGLGKTMTFLKERKENEKNVLLLDQGDTWQGSLYSNINHGELITDVMNYVQYDARTIGNHDFDWGVEYVKKNTAKKYNGYATPVLGANIYDYNFETKQFGNTQQSELGVPSVTYTFDGVKVGVIGTIGSSQITSINSLYMHDLGFKDHISTIKSEATKLRNEGCDVIISSIHAGQNVAMNRGLEDYVDLVLCGHTHDEESGIDNGLHFYQFSEYTKMIGDIGLTFNRLTKEISVEATSLKSSTLDQMIDEVDPTIQGIINSYIEKANQEDQPNKVIVANAVGNFGEYQEGPNLMANAIYDYALDSGYDVDLAFTNQLRHDLSNGEWSYADIYQAAPFDNNIYIIDVTLDEFADEIMKYNYICKNESNLELELGKTYKVACIDFLAFHTDSLRDYDYFPSMNGKDINSIPKLDKSYRAILRDWLLENGYDSPNNELRATDYRSSKAKFSKNTIVFPKCQVDFYCNDGTNNIGATSSVTYGKAIGPYLPIGAPVDRDGYTFTGWYYDKAGNNAVYYYDLVKDNLDIYAGWIENDDSIYRTNILDYTVFLPGTTTTYANAYNGNNQGIQLEFQTSSIIDNSSYQEFNIEAGGFIYLSSPTGFMITSFEIAQWRYNNISMFESSSVDETNQLDISHDVATISGQSFYVHSYNGNGINEIYAYNTYSGPIYLKYVKVTLERI